MSILAWQSRRAILWVWLWPCTTTTTFSQEFKRSNRGPPVSSLMSNVFSYCDSFLKSNHQKLDHVSIETHGDLGIHLKKPPYLFHPCVSFETIHPQQIEKKVMTTLGGLHFSQRGSCFYGCRFSFDMSWSSGYCQNLERSWEPLSPRNPYHCSSVRDKSRESLVCKYSINAFI